MLPCALPDDKLQYGSLPPASVTRAECRSTILWLGHPAALFAFILIIHFVGRDLALNGPARVDSFIYSLNAYAFYDPHATASDLVNDKPGGQAILTGWVYRLSSVPPTRLALVPIESAFMLAAYAVLAALTFRVLETRRTDSHGPSNLAIAAALTLFFVIAENVYNALDGTTDGFNLGENYLLLPVLGAVYAHLTVRGPLRRGLIRGVCIGLALTIKQTAVAVLVAALLDGTLTLIRRPARLHDAIRATLASVVGIALGVLPLVIFLGLRGWLGDQLHAVLQQSGRHIGARFSALEVGHLEPVLPLLWWIALGAAAWAACLLTQWFGRTQRDAANACQGVTSLQNKCSNEATGAFQFALIWLAMEVALLAAMVKPSTHYYQPVVAPLVLLAACAARRLQQSSLWNWIGVTAAGLAVLAALPLINGVRARGGWPDLNYERRAFAGWLAKWPAAPAPEWMHPPTGEERR
jgi:hypothetical protein